MKLLLILLCVLLAIPAQAKEPEPVFQPAAGLAVGVVVVCVGGYCIYKMVKVCQKVFPKSTNSNSGFFFYAQAGDEYGGAYEYSSPGSCYVPPDSLSLQEDLTKNPTTFTLGVAVNGGNVTTTMSADASEGSSQDWAGFAAEMATHGLHLTGRAQGDPQFALNGIPCDACVPLSFDPLTGRVIHATGGPLRRVVVERSVNLQDWSPFLVTDVGDGARFSVVDTSRSAQAFYRVSLL
jgi:hypothetical protein